MNLRCFPDWLLCLHSLVWNPCVVRLYVLFVAIILPWCHGAILSWFHGDTMGWWLHYVWRRPSDCPASWSPGPVGGGKWLWSSSLQIYCSVSGNITNITTPSLPHHHHHHLHLQQQRTTHLQQKLYRYEVRGPWYLIGQNCSLDIWCWCSHHLTIQMHRYFKLWRLKNISKLKLRVFESQSRLC